MNGGKKIVKKRRKFKFKKLIPMIILVLGMVLTGTMIAANIFRDNMIIKKNKSVVVKSNTNNKSATKKERKLDINSRLVKNLYRIVYDDRKGNLNSWIYPDVDKLLISEMDPASKLKLVMSNMESAYFSENDCNIIGAKTITVNKQRYMCDVSVDGYISVDNVLNKYTQLYGNSDDFDKTLSIVASGAENAIFVYAVDKATNKEGYYRYISSNNSTEDYTYTRKLVKATETNGIISITENIVITDNAGQTKEENIVYTFKLEDDGVYTYYSRERNQS